MLTLLFFYAKKYVTFSVTYFDAVSIQNIAKVDFNLGYMHDINGANNRFNFVDKRVREFNINTAINFESIHFLSGNLNIRACWITYTTNLKYTKSTQFNGRSNAFAGAFTVTSSIHFYVMATLIMPITLSTGWSFFLAVSGIKDQQILISTQRSFFNNNVLIDLEYSWHRACTIGNE